MILKLVNKDETCRFIGDNVPFQVKVNQCEEDQVILFMMTHINFEGNVTIPIVED
jgi:hypothetical protein